MSQLNPEELARKAFELAGREVEVEETADGQFIVSWMAYGLAPPPKGATPIEALSNFCTYLEQLKASAMVLPSDPLPEPAADEDNFFD